MHASLQLAAPVAAGRTTASFRFEPACESAGQCVGCVSRSVARTRTLGSVLIWFPKRLWLRSTQPTANCRPTAIAAGLWISMP
jgi:hypothetical protein